MADNVILSLPYSRIASRIDRQPIASVVRLLRSISRSIKKRLQPQLQCHDIVHAAPGGWRLEPYNVMTLYQRLATPAGPGGSPLPQTLSMRALGGAQN